MRRRTGIRLAILTIGLGTVSAVAEAPGKGLTGKWTFLVGPPRADSQLATMQWKQEGETLTGQLTLPGGTTTEILGGTVAKDRVSFFIQPNPDGPKIHHTGEVLGDTIKGKTEIERPGQPRRPHFAWEARRIGD